MRWAILDGDDLYVPRTWPVREDAEDARSDLLRPFPLYSEWRKRLIIRDLDVQVAPAKKVRKEKTGPIIACACGCGAQLIQKKKTSRFATRACAKKGLDTRPRPTCECRCGCGRKVYSEGAFFSSFCEKRDPRSPRWTSDDRKRRRAKLAA